MSARLLACFPPAPGRHAWASGKRVKGCSARGPARTPARSGKCAPSCVRALPAEPVLGSQSSGRDQFQRSCSAPEREEVAAACAGPASRTPRHLALCWWCFNKASKVRERKRAFHFLSLPARFGVNSHVCARCSAHIQPLQEGIGILCGEPLPGLRPHAGTPPQHT